MAGKKERELALDIKSLEQNMELITVPEMKQQVIKHISNKETTDMELA